MKKYTIYFLLTLISFVILTACGTDQKENPDNTGPYAFFNATTPLTITLNSDANGTLINTSYTISVQLLEYGLVKSGESVEMKPFDFKYGFVTNNIVLTDVNGMANFTFNLPSSYNQVKGQDVTIQAVYFDPTQVIVNAPNTIPTKRRVLLTQDFVLKFR
jgi:hypothetical protein